MESADTQVQIQTSLTRITQIPACNLEVTSNMLLSMQKIAQLILMEDRSLQQVQWWTEFEGDHAWSSAADALSSGYVTSSLLASPKRYSFARWSSSLETEDRDRPW